MKLAIVSKHFLPYQGGIEYRILEVARWMTKKNVDITVYTTHEENTKDEEEIEGIKVKRSRALFSFSSASFAPKTLKNLLDGDFDLAEVHAPDPASMIYTYIACRIKGKPYIVMYHADILRSGFLTQVLRRLYLPLQKLILGSAKKILVTTKAYAKDSESLKGFEEKLIESPSFVDTTRFNPEIDPKEITLKHGLEDKKTVLFVGRLVAYKGLDVLLEAHKKVVSELECVKLIIVGEGPLKEELRVKSENSGLGDSVIFTGKIRDGDLPKYYAACDVFALPSVTRQEAFGLVLVEAMACGKPCITSDFSGMPHVLGESGITITPKDPDKLRYALLNLLCDEEQRHKLGGEARMRAEKYFSVEAVCNNLLHTYTKAIET
ncbi:MAG: glycosyltransferase [Candidatus Altiarchaeales archaeon]|nr:glycosyltransferase [Candidatus Altiarchaeales archaeon]